MQLLCYKPVICIIQPSLTDVTGVAKNNRSTSVHCSTVQQHHTLRHLKEVKQMQSVISFTKGGFITGLVWLWVYLINWQMRVSASNHWWPLNIQHVGVQLLGHWLPRAFISPKPYLWCGTSGTSKLLTHCLMMASREVFLWEPAIFRQGRSQSFAEALTLDVPSADLNVRFFLRRPGSLPRGGSQFVMSVGDISCMFFHCELQQSHLMPADNRKGPSVSWFSMNVAL